jgi:hypothetical protein
MITESGAGRAGRESALNKLLQRNFRNFYETDYY